MKIKYSLSVVMLSFKLVYGADTTTKMPAGNYYEYSNLAHLTEQGIRKHAPLAIIIDQKRHENPNDTDTALTQHFANILQTAFIPTIVSHSVVYNYFIRRDQNKKHFNSKVNPVSFDEWHLYDIPDSSLFLFVPRRYMQYYNGFGFNLTNLINISATLPITGDYKPIITYMESRRANIMPFSVRNLQTVLTLVKQPFRSDSKAQLTKQELKYQDQQQPIWDIILQGHGTYKGNIADLKPSQIQDVLDFFNNKLPIGTVHIETCSAGGENLNLLEFATTVNKERILRNLDYILIVGSITDTPTFYNSELDYQFYNNAARLQDRGKTLNRLLNSLYNLDRRPRSLHGSSNIPQVWLPGGLGFQTYQINEKVQILGNVKVRVHEDEQRAIKLPNSTMVLLVYAPIINVPLLVEPAEIFEKYDTIEFIRELSHRNTKWAHIPTIAEFAEKKSFSYYDFLKKISLASSNYPALMHILTLLEKDYLYEQYMHKAVGLIYPEFISMLRGDLTTQYINKIELQPLAGKERELTGVMHFIRDAFFDIDKRKTKKIFLIEELTGNNDISALLELYRFDNNRSNQKSLLFPRTLELKLRSSIGKHITLKKIRVTTVKDKGSLQFIYGSRAWSINFELPGKKMYPDFWEFKQIDPAEYQHSFIASRNSIMPEPTKQKSIREVLLQKAATYQALKLTDKAPTVALQPSPTPSGPSARSTQEQEQKEGMLRNFENVQYAMPTTIQNIKKVFLTATIEPDIKQIIMQYLNQIKIAKQDIDTHSESTLSLKASIDRYMNAKDALDLLVHFGSIRQDILNTITTINAKSKDVKINPNITKAININVNKAKEIKLYVTTLPEIISAHAIENLRRTIAEYMQIRDNLISIARR